VNDLYPALMRRRPGAVRGFMSLAGFLDIGTPDDYLTTSLDVAGRERRHGALVGARTSVASSARLSDTILWDDVVVEDGCELIRSVVADGVRIPTGSRFSDSTIVPISDRPLGSDERREGDLLIAPIARRRSAARR
jgi:NDP-sugar pyrophosphorylase family protein